MKFRSSTATIAFYFSFTFLWFTLQTPASEFRHANIIQTLITFRHRGKNIHSPTNTIYFFHIIKKQIVFLQQKLKTYDKHTNIMPAVQEQLTNRLLRLNEIKQQIILLQQKLPPLPNTLELYNAINKDILSVIFHQFLTIQDILILRKSCKDFQILLRPNEQNMDIFCKNFRSKEIDEQKFEPKPREFVQTLATTRKKCGKKETTMCEESIVWYPSDPKKDLIYANCHQSAWAIYLHATETDCALCCSTELQETMNEIKKKDSVRISKFITGIKQIEFDSICFVEMKQEGPHYFTLEVRKEKGYCIYSSWANVFTLEWFLDLQENNIQTLVLAQKLPEELIIFFQNLRNKCGKQKLVNLEELETCVGLFAELQNDSPSIKFLCKKITT